MRPDVFALQLVVIGDTLFNIAHAAVAEFDHVFVYDFIWSFLFVLCVNLPHNLFICFLVLFLYRQSQQSNPKQREDQRGANKAMQLQKQNIVSTARQLSPKRSRLPGHRHTDQHIYIGITENEFKTRYNQHTSSFKLCHKSSATSLSEHIWKLKENNTDHTVTWKILEKAQPYTPTTGKCNLCTSKKVYIAYTDPSLNKRR